VVAISKIEKDLLAGRRYCASEIPSEFGIGIYALFLKRKASLRMLELADSDLLYVGMTESSLQERNHFLHDDSSFSSPRRSLGALLKERLTLTAVPRGQGTSRRDCCNYRFAGDGEKALTKWMHDNLAYGYVALDTEADLKEVEGALIKHLSPPLNLTKSRNQSRRAVRQARKACRDEAAGNANRG
jgi:hypothetical protein